MTNVPKCNFYEHIKTNRRIILREYFGKKAIISRLGHRYPGSQTSLFRDENPERSHVTYCQPGQWSNISPSRYYMPAKIDIFLPKHILTLHHYLSNWLNLHTSTTKCHMFSLICANRNLEPYENNNTKLDNTNRKVSKNYCVSFDFLAEDEKVRYIISLCFIYSTMYWIILLRITVDAPTASGEK